MGLLVRQMFDGKALGKTETPGPGRSFGTFLDFLKWITGLFSNKTYNNSCTWLDMDRKHIGWRKMLSTDDFQEVTGM